MGDAPVIKILKSDHTEDQQAFIEKITAEVFSPSMPYKDLASGIKAAWDKEYGNSYPAQATQGVYHCIAGTNFAVSVTHETYCASYWSCNNVKILLFKSKDSPFD